eukprot:292081-Pyramimonas_sp.AAC.1
MHTTHQTQISLGYLQKSIDYITDGSRCSDPLKRRHAATAPRGSTARTGSQHLDRSLGTAVAWPQCEFTVQNDTLYKSIIREI